MTHYIGGEAVSGEGTAEEATMACRHHISETRVRMWWERAEARRDRDPGVCTCCGGPCGTGAIHCIHCVPRWGAGGALL